MKKRMTTVILFFTVVLMILAGCSAPDDDSTTAATQPSTQAVQAALTADAAVWEIDPSCGGYAIETEALSCKVVVDGEYKYSQFRSVSDGRTVELYSSPTELLLIHSVDGETQYYRETYAGNAQGYANPLTAVFEALRHLDFQLNEQTDEHLIYEAVETELIVEEQQIPYTLYELEMVWTDGKTYVYRFYDFSDGAVLISAEAPNEINPLITADTPWAVDVSALCVRNTRTGDAIPITVNSTTTGQALSPDGGDVTTVEWQRSIYAYISTDTGKLERLQYQDGADVTILYEAKIQKPEITPDMTEMDSDTLQLAMMLAYAIESLLAA